ncbi:MAG: uroporphyrinogen-III synthase [Gammaproteobacteria bacterium]
MATKLGRFIITRPLHQAENLGRAIQALGGEPLYFPTLEIEFLSNWVDILEHSFDNIVFVSANAVLAVMPHWAKLKTAPHVFAVGSGTAHRLSQNGISATLPSQGQFHSEGLLALFAQQILPHQSILIFSGENGRTWLADHLRQAGAVVEQVAVYKRQKPAIDMTLLTAQTQPIAAIICSSASSLQHLWEMVGPEKQAWLCEQQLVVISPKMVALVQDLGFKKMPWVAENASDAEIIKVIEKECFA